MSTTSDEPESDALNSLDDELHNILTTAHAIGESGHPLNHNILIELMHPAINKTIMEGMLELIGPHTSLSSEEIKGGRIYVLSDPQADAVDRYKDELAKAVTKKYGRADNE